MLQYWNGKAEYLAINLTVVDYQPNDNKKMHWHGIAKFEHTGKRDSHHLNVRWGLFFVFIYPMDSQVEILLDEIKDAVVKWSRTCKIAKYAEQSRKFRESLRQKVELRRALETAHKEMEKHAKLLLQHIDRGGGREGG